MLGIKDNIIFSKERIGFHEMKALYNMCDTIVNRSCNEGFGLPTLEMMMCGKPIIALKTGGLTRQVEDPETGEQFGIGLDPEVRTMIGNHMVPYIYEDFVSHETVSKAFMKMFDMGPEERERLGTRAMERAKKEYSMDRVIKDWDRTLTETIDNWKSTPNKTWTVKSL
jgi:glycosyltransferase involved in cell wall biosynthesis